LLDKKSFKNAKLDLGDTSEVRSKKFQDIWLPNILGHGSSKEKKRHGHVDLVGGKSNRRSARFVLRAPPSIYIRFAAPSTFLRLRHRLNAAWPTTSVHEVFVSLCFFFSFRFTFGNRIQPSQFLNVEEKVEGDDVQGLLVVGG
jgi:hypothetical protein